MTGAALTEPECQVLRFGPSVCLTLALLVSLSYSSVVCLTLSCLFYSLSALPVSLKYCLCHSQQSDSHYPYLSLSLSLPVCCIACLTFSILAMEFVKFFFSFSVPVLISFNDSEFLKGNLFYKM